jgi:hypothetical protein
MESALEPYQCADDHGGEHSDEDHQFLGGDGHGDLLSTTQPPVVFRAELWHATPGCACLRSEIRLERYRELFGRVALVEVTGKVDFKALVGIVDDLLAR